MDKETYYLTMPTYEQVDLKNGDKVTITDKENSIKLEGEYREGEIINMKDKKEKHRRERKAIKEIITIMEQEEVTLSMVENYLSKIN